MAQLPCGQQTLGRQQLHESGQLLGRLSCVCVCPYRAEPRPLHDVALATFDILRACSRRSPRALMDARLKEVCRRHRKVRAATVQSVSGEGCWGHSARGQLKDGAPCPINRCSYDQLLPSSGQGSVFSHGESGSRGPGDLRWPQWGSGPGSPASSPPDGSSRGSSGRQDGPSFDHRALVDLA